MRSFRVPVTLVSVLALLSSASAQFVQSGSQFVEGPLSLEVVDLDQDGDRDVLLGARSGVSVLWNQDGQGDLSAPELLVATEVTAHAVDVNGDGAPDLVCSQEMNGGIRWYRNLGMFGLGPAQTIDGWNAASKIRSADVDLDGDLDLILA
ncbi:MAG TPA: VCBS repeat-containing protein, partial [Flavobacteriales bacterium]|nr:VCBS repeat-containing protein [Flavobacteriales bacterium]